MQLLRGLGLFVATCCLAWVGVLWHWQTTQRDMSSQDILLYLGALPFTLFILVLATSWAWRGAPQRITTPADQLPAPGVARSLSSTATGDERARHTTAQLLTARIGIAAGSTVDDLMEAIQSGAPRPTPDAELRDEQGMPVISARAQDVDVSIIAREMASVQTECDREAGWVGTPSDAMLRALSLLAAQLESVIEDLSPWSDRLRASTGHLGRMGPQSPVRIRVLVAWPVGLSHAERELAQAWLDGWLRSHAESVVAPDAWMQHPTMASSGPELWLEADRLLAALADEGLNDLVLLGACHSDLDAAVIRRLSDAEALLCATRPKGIIPGEGAAVLVLAGPTWSAAKPGVPSVAHLHRAVVARRDKAIDASGRVNAELASQLLCQSLAVAQLEADVVAGLASDADQHSPRATEMFDAALACLPAIDAAGDVCMAGHLTGRTGVVATLLAVAMAANRSVQAGRPWAALSVADPHWRLGLVARSENPPPSAGVVPITKELQDNKAGP